MSHGIAPSKSTVYVSNLPFSLTNNDLYKIFEKFGKIVKVTILKDKKTRESKGVAFILFLKEDDAINCISSFNGKMIGERVIHMKIAKDNGRSREFIRKRVYEDKSRCYECGEEGHLSYECPKNTLGYRKPPPKKKKKRTMSNIGESKVQYYELSDDDYLNVDKKNTNTVNYSSNEDEDTEEPDLETLSAAIRFEQDKISSEINTDASDIKQSKKRIRKSTYFSDEEELSE